MNTYDNKMRSQRTSKVNTLRILYWIQALPQKPGRIIPVLLYVLAFVWAWNMREVFLPQVDNSVMLTLYQYGVAAAIILLFGSLFLVLLLVLTRPRRANQYESALIQIGFAPHNGLPPTLIARLPIKYSQVYRLVFYSLGVSMREWVTHKEDIEDALNLHYVEAPQYGGRNGNNRNIIVLTVAPGVGSNNTAALYDDEL